MKTLWRECREPWLFRRPSQSLAIGGGTYATSDQTWCFLYRLFPQGCDRLGCPAKACWFTMFMNHQHLWVMIPHMLTWHPSIVPLVNDEWMIMRSGEYHVEFEAVKYMLKHLGLRRPFLGNQKCHGNGKTSFFWMGKLMKPRLSKGRWRWKSCRRSTDGDCRKVKDGF